MRAQAPSVTSIPRSPEQERRSRMTKYLVTMSIRIICLVLMLFVHGWWLAVVAAGAILLPYFAVVLGNVGSSWVSRAERPTAIEVYRGSGEPAPAPAPDGAPFATTDAEPPASSSPAATDGHPIFTIHPQPRSEERRP